MSAKNPYFSLKINEDDISVLISSITRTLRDLDVEYFLCENNHMSLAYVEGTYDEVSLVNALKEISLSGIRVRVSGIEILDGLKTEFDYLALKINSDNTNFELAHEFLTDRFDVAQEFGGNKFSPHVSIIKFNKSSMSKEDKENLCRFLETVNADITCRCEIVAESVELFNNEFKKLASFGMKK